MNMRQILTAGTLVGAAALALTFCAGQAYASEATIDITQDGANVVATASGDIDLTGLSENPGTGSQSAFVQPGYAAILLGSGTYDVYYGVTGPSSFGSGGTTDASSGSGGPLGLFSFNNYLDVPDGFVSGSSISATATLDSTTIAGLGLKPGTYNYTWNDGSNSLTVVIGEAVPEPSTWAMILIGFAGLGFAGYRRSRQLA